MAERSAWLDEALAGEVDAPALSGTIPCDVCVVGGGFTGLWTAFRLKELEPALDVVLLEQDVCGGGASGRNGGFVLTWWSKFPSLKKAVGADEAVRLCRATEQAVDDIGALAAEHGIACGYRRRGWLWAATSEAQVGAWQETINMIATYGGRYPFVELAPEEVARDAGSPRHVAGVYEAVCASVQPAKLARGLRRIVMERGVRVFEHSKVLDFAPEVRTGSGSVRAETVVVATGAWLGLNNRALAIIPSDVILTEPLESPPLSDGLCCSDSRLMVNYYREHEGRLVFGKGGGSIAFAGRAGVFNGVSPRAPWVETSFRALYPHLAHARVERSWMGPIDRAKAGVPFFYRDGATIYGAGYSGVGVCQTSIGGRILASLALRRDDEWARSGLVRRPSGSFPPEPIRYVGGLLVRSGVARKEDAEDAGRRPSVVSNWLASLAPPGFVPGARASVPAAAEEPGLPASTAG
jgi:glycine/D-amino acid oxidase-like deaminating enzyme